MRSLLTRQALAFVLLIPQVLALLGACVNHQPAPDPFFEKWQNKAKTSQPYTPPPPRKQEVSTTIDAPRQSTPLAPLSQIRPEVAPARDTPGKGAPVPPLQKMHVVSEKDLPHDLISVRFFKEDLETVLRTLARIANQNILFSPTLISPPEAKEKGYSFTSRTDLSSNGAEEGKIAKTNAKKYVTVQAEGVPWSTVFMGIIKSYDLVVTKEEKINLLSVKSIEEERYKLKLEIADKKEQEALESALLKQQKAMEIERQKDQAEIQLTAPLTTKIVPINFSEPKEIAASVSGLLTKGKDGKPRGFASEDQHSRSVIIQETGENIDNLLKLVDDLDKPTSQILIEAHIVETTKDVARELGIQWGALTPDGVLGDTRVNVTPGTSPGTIVNHPAVPFYVPTRSAGSLIPPASNPTLGPELNYPNLFQPAEPSDLVALAPDLTAMDQNVNLAASAIKGLNPASIGLILGGKDLLLSAQLSALQRDGKLNILSSPSIATLDNSEAIIESGKSIPFVTVVDGTPTVQYKDATLNLTVIPHVITDQAIRLNIVAKKDEVDTANTVSGNPLITKKLAKTQLIVANDATVVLAGLSKETHSGANTGVPGLKDVPGLGWLFKKDSKSEEFEELLIFITPKILNRSGPQATKEVAP